MVIGESVEVVLPRSPENAEQLTPKYASLVFFNSFRHSQGTPLPLQRDIFTYLHITNPTWKITPEDKPKILEISQKMIFSYLYGEEDVRKDGVILHNNYALTKGMVNTTIVNQLDEMQEQFNDQEKSDPEKKRELIQKISNSIIGKDWVFLQRGRERSPPDSKKPFMDPWLSFIVHFGLNKNSTEIPELDEMYKDIRAFITRPGAKITENFTETLKMYRQKHPGVKINLKP